MQFDHNQGGGLFSFYMVVMKHVKIYLIISTTLRSKRKIVLNVVSSEIISLLLTNLIIWDEAPMTNKFCFEALDKSLKDIMSANKNSSKKIFGGKVVVVDGDFRRIIPIIPRDSRSDIVHATMNASRSLQNPKANEEQHRKSKNSHNEY